VFLPRVWSSGRFALLWKIRRLRWPPWRRCFFGQSRTPLPMISLQTHLEFYLCSIDDARQTGKGNDWKEAKNRFCETVMINQIIAKLPPEN
jgi:hypothetical protein